jgi:hypothetical protein
MTRREMFRERLEQAFRGSRYHSFLSSLKGVSEEAALRPPPLYKGFSHMDGSILSLAFHTAGDKHVLISHAFGDGAVTWADVQARFESLGGGMKAVLELAEEGHALVLATLDGLKEEDLDAPRPYYGGRTHTAGEIFTIIAEHDLYHAGQINYSRCIMT